MRNIDTHILHRRNHSIVSYSNFYLHLQCVTINSRKQYAVGIKFNLIQFSY